MLTAEQRARLKQAETAERPVFIVTPDEARENERDGTSETATWRFSATNVRDFAWASSRKFIWDARGMQQPGADQKQVMAMSFYPKGRELGRTFHRVVLRARVYTRFTSIPYPHRPVRQRGFLGGMKYR